MAKIIHKIKPYVPKNTNKLVLIGEAPGKTEIEQGVPFVGTSGQYMRKLLTKAGIDPTECYMTNAFLTRPFNNEISRYFVNGKVCGEITPTQQYQQVRLFQELHRLPPARIQIAWGRIAGWVMLGDAGKNNGYLYKFIATGTGWTLRLPHPRYLAFKQGKPEETEAIACLSLALAIAKRLAH